MEQGFNVTQIPIAGRLGKGGESHAFQRFAQVLANLSLEAATAKVTGCKS